MLEWLGSEETGMRGCSVLLPSLETRYTMLSSSLLSHLGITKHCVKNE